jgi:hypothetical protein
VPLPPDTERDTRLLFAFRPADLPWVLAAILASAVFVVLPLPLVARIVLGMLVPGIGLVGLAVGAPEHLARLRRAWSDSPGRYIGQPTAGNVRARYPGGALGVALEVLPPPSAGRGGPDLDGERAAWVRVLRRLKSAAAPAAVTVEMVPDAPPQPGWELPAGLPLPPGYGRFAEMRRSHFEALVRDGRAQRPRVLLRLAVSERSAAGVDPALRLDRLANGVAAELQATGALALPVDIDVLRGAGDPEPAPAAEPTAPPAKARLGIGMPLRLGRLWQPPSKEPPEAPAEKPAEAVPIWPDPDGWSAIEGRTWDIGLVVLGALPRVGASTALASWARGRPDRGRWALLDANPDRPGGLRLAFQGDVVSVPTSGTPEEAARAVVAASRALRVEGKWPAVDLGSPPPVTELLRAHPAVTVAAQAAAVAVVTRQDAAALFATERLLNALAALGAAGVRVWVAAYDTADPVTLAEMRGLFGCEVEEAPLRRL